MLRIHELAELCFEAHGHAFCYTGKVKLKLAGSAVDLISQQTLRQPAVYVQGIIWWGRASAGVSGSSDGRL